MEIGDFVSMDTLVYYVDAMAERNGQYVVCDGANEYLFTNVPGYGLRLDSIEAV